jgi:AcrR family transcriptional regulator
MAEKNTISTRDRIFQEATKLFSREGYHAVSIRNIATEVGIKQSSIYNHFGSKEDILNEILTEFDNELSGREFPEEVFTQLIREKSPEEVFRISSERFIQYWQNEQRTRMWFIVSMEQYRNKKAAQIIIDETDRNLHGLSKIFQMLMNEGKITETDPFTLAVEYGYSIRALHLEFELRRLHDMHPEEIQERMDQRIQTFVQGIRK